jgi:hypothetical protein
VERTDGCKDMGKRLCPRYLVASYVVGLTNTGWKTYIIYPGIFLSKTL